MSGVFGIIDGQRRPSVPKLAQAMAERLRLRPWYNVNHRADPNAGVGLGQVNIGLFCHEPQPVQALEGRLWACFFGEFFNADELRRQAFGEKHQEAGGSLAELILALYQRHGTGFIRDLDGQFALAIWDGERGRLVVANDRFGLYPVYYAHYNHKLLFAPEMKGILADADFERCLNLTALAEFMRFQRLLGDKTFFEGLHLLPYASLLQFEPATDSLKVEHYWDFDQTPAWPAGADFDDAVAETGRLLRRAVNRRAGGDLRVGVYLSGGLDSRTVLGFIQREHFPITSITYGVPGCRDAIYAAKIARRVGSDHHFFPQPDGRWIPELVDFHLEVTEGFIPFIHGHAGPTLEPARELIDVNLTGFDGDQIIGARGVLYAGPATHAADDVAFIAHMFTNLNQHFSWPGITEAEEKLLYTPETYARVRDRAFESLAHEFNKFAQFEPARRVDYLMAIYQGSRLSNYNLVYQRAFFEVRYPFVDNQLMDLVHSMPMEYRLRDRLYLAVINREIPNVTWVPRDTDEKLLTDRRLIREAHGLWQRVRRRAFGLTARTIHEDPENWLRHDAREWAESILFDPRTLERGIFNPAFLRSIFERHMSGREIHTIGKIAPLITFEMMLRRFYDC